ncbi:MAG: hypothetical protein HY895_12100 [Deltaproteobacteria bacterium]|nr:hypothetical protein [Deltaproteobacteria bacterium]
MLAAVFLISVSTLAFEVLLARMFAFTQWNHLSFLVISIALFGFAASGTLFTMAAPAVARWRGVHWSLLVVLFSASMLAAVIGMTRIPLDYHRLALQPLQAVYLFAVYLLLALPFLFSGGLVSAAYMAQPQHTAAIYFAVMAGSALGVLLPVPLLSVGSEPGLVVIAAMVPLAAPGVMLTDDWRRRSRHDRGAVLAVSAAGLLVLMAAAWLLTPGAQEVRDPKPSEFKFLSQIQSLPGTRIVATTADIRGRVDRVQGPHLRFAPGLSLKHAAPLPQATAVLTDGDRPVFLYDRSAAANAHFARDTLSFAGYELHGRPGSVLVLLSGGGQAVACALASGAGRIQIQHANPRVADQIRSHYGLPVAATPARSYLAQSAERFDIVHVESPGASMPGADALDQDHLLTIEAFGEYLRHLSPNGVLIVSRRLLLPPADSLRLWATARQALARGGATHPERSIIILRSWDTYTLMVFQEPPADPALIQEVAHRGNFDVVYADGADDSLSNRYNVFDAPYHFREHLQLASAVRKAAAEEYFRDYAMDVAPQTDRQPFPGHFLKWSRLPDLYRMLGSRLHAFGLSGEVVVALALAEAFGVSAMLLLLPIAAIKRRRERIPWRVTIFFLGIGAGFMHAELLFVYLGTYLLGDPVISLTLTLAGTLVSSGLGGLWSGMRGAGCLRASTGAAALVLGLAAAGLMLFSSHVLALPAPVRGAVLLAAVMIPGFLMGMPFPLAMRHLAQSTAVKAYAWSANGCASVLASILSAQIAIAAGFEWVLAAAVITYGIAFMAFLRTRLTMGTKTHTVMQGS